MRKKKRKKKKDFVNLVSLRLRPTVTLSVCEARKKNLLVCSLPLHRHSYIGFNSFRFIDINKKGFTLRDDLKGSVGLMSVGLPSCLDGVFVHHIRGFLAY